MSALEAWLLYVALVGWGLFGVLCWLTWRLSWRDLRWRAALKSDPPRLCVHGASAGRFCEHCAAGRKMTQGEVVEELERILREGR